MPEGFLRNQPCWCGSGLKYKKCHLHREGQKALPGPALRKELQRALRRKICLHPEASASTCGRIIAAHTIQKAGALRAVADAKHHACTFFPLGPGQAGDLGIRRVGLKEASTFTAFCERHDTPAFAPLETRLFAASAEQCFLIAYRAMCTELYQKLTANQSHPIMRHLIDRGLSPDAQRHFQHFYSVMGAGTSKGLEEAYANKLYLDSCLLRQEYDALRYLLISFTGPLCIASTGAPTPDTNLSGQVIQTLHDPNAHIQPLLHGTVPCESGGALVLAWRPDHEAITNFVEGLKRVPLDELPSLLVQLLFAYCENTYFSEEWWRTLPFDQQKHLSSLALEPIPYYRRVHFISGVSVPWTKVRLDAL